MARTKTWTLLGTRRFLPLMITQFLGAFNDSLFRSAIIMLVTFRLAEQVGIAAGALNNIAIASFIAPYFLFSALAGQLADKYEKSQQIFWIKIWEIGLMVLGAAGFYYQNLLLLIAVLSGLGLQSTFFGPLKYGILPDLVKNEELLAANALIEAGTFIAILLGSIVGGLVILSGEGLNIIIMLTISVAASGAMSSVFIPGTGRAAPELRIRRNIFASTRMLLTSARTNPINWPAIIGISWIWTLGSIYISQIPVVVKENLGGDEAVVTLILACFSIGIGIGSLATNKWLAGKISSRLAAPGLTAVMLASLAIYSFLPEAEPQDILTGIGAFLSHGINWVILFAMVGLAVAAGAVIVPLYAILQERSPKEECSRAIAANNIMNAAFMVCGSLSATILIQMGLLTEQVLLITGLFGLVIAFFVRPLERRL